MTPIKSPVLVRTAFADYELTHIIGEGGAGRVYRGVAAETGEPVAIKILTNLTRDKRQRFKNETAFLARTKHLNLVPALDSGMAEGVLTGPFYVMPLYDGSLRSLMKKPIEPTQVMAAFSQIMDGVEAAHFLGITHRDLKPENILVGENGRRFVIADFGVASFAAEELHTFVETKPTQRLANFSYAAPEQRAHGKPVGVPADIWALGLILNELFTGEIPHGTAHQTIASVAPDFAFLDILVARMTSQSPGDRPASIDAVKGEIEKYRSEFVSRQRLEALSREVVPDGEITDPLALREPKIVGVNWDDGRLTITLDMVTTAGWQQLFKHRLRYSSAVYGIGPEMFGFSGDKVWAAVPERSAQDVINHFKQWLSIARSQYRVELQDEIDQLKARRIKELIGARRLEEQRLQVNSRLTF